MTPTQTRRQLVAPSDRTLVERWCEGDYRAADQLIDRYCDSIHAYFRLRVREPDSEDLLQETLVKLNRAVHRYEYRSSFRAYLFRIAEHTLKDYLRAAYRRPVIEPLDDEQVGDEAPAAEHTLLGAEDVRAALICVDALAPEARDLVNRFYVQGLTTPEIARQDGVPPGTIRRRLYDARCVMRKHHQVTSDALTRRNSPSDERVRSFLGLS